MTPQEVADAILLLGPGFVLLKALALTGGQPQRLQWEWVVWSVLLSVPVAASTTWLMPQLGELLGMASLHEWEPAARFLVAVVVGVALGLLWIAVRRSRRAWLRGIYRSVIDSAWDLALDDASRPAPGGGNYGVEVTVDTGSGEAIYFGGLGAFGYERVKAEPWLFLTYTQRWEGEGRGFEPLPRTEGLLIHRLQIKRLRIIQPPPPSAPAKTKSSGNDASNAGHP